MDKEYVIGAMEEIETALVALRKVYWTRELSGLTETQTQSLRVAIMSLSNLETELGAKLS